MDFRYPPEAEAFRTEFRAWLDANLPGDVLGRGLGGSLEVDHSTLDSLRAWNRTLADARYAAIAWPEEWGGRGASVMEQVVYVEEMHRARAPGTLNPLGLSNIAPAIIEHGTEEQKRSLLPRMLRGDDIWCQGFSEPNAGSDLASLRTQAVRDGECWIVNGQKTWNTLGHMANWCELLVRTDPAVPKHKGITCLLVDMTLPGVEVRPLVTITGDKEFNEIFFTDVRVPVDCTLGPVNEGWRVAMTTLAYERGTVAKLHTGTRGRSRGSSTRRARSRSATAAWPPTIRCCARSSRRPTSTASCSSSSPTALSAELHGRAMGPEGSIAKLLWSETEQHVAELASDVLGPDALSGPWARSRLQPGAHDRRRHHPGEQEHPGPKDARAPRH